MGYVAGYFVGYYTGYYDYYYGGYYCGCYGGYYGYYYGCYGDCYGGCYYDVADYCDKLVDYGYFDGGYCDYLNSDRKAGFVVYTLV